MFILCADKNKLMVRRREPLTSGSVNVNTVQFEFSPEWDGLTRTAVFRNGTENRSILLDDTSQCEIPREVLSAAWQRVYAGVYGTSGQEIVLPTIWADLGVVLEGAAPGGELYPPTPELWEQELARKQDKLYGEPGQLVGFDESGNAVAQNAGEATQGPPGPQGVPGEDGKSAYQIAVENGFEGTEEEWLSSLKGAPGTPGAPGRDGPPGAAGADGSPGADGTTFTPSVSSDGVLSWTNDGNLTNPEPINIKGPAGQNGTDLTAGVGLTIEDGVASVDTPVRSILTEAEFDALPESERSKGLYFLAKEASEGGGSSGGGYENIYSTEETRIGTWIDGKPLYRKVFSGNFGPINQRNIIANVANLNIENAISGNGFALTSNSYNVFLPNAATSSYAFVDIVDNTIGVKTNNTALANQPVTIILEYTKTTDELGVSG